MKVWIFRPLIFTSVSVFALCWLSTCSTANEDDLGNCKPIDNGGKYVGSPYDVDGKEWKFNFVDSATIKCFNEGVKMRFRLNGSIQDSRGQLKPGIITNVATFGSSQYFKFLEDDNSTQLISDSCGLVSYAFEGTCPPESKSLSINVYAFSGALKSKDAEITIENFVQPTATPTPGGTAAPAP
jgi:hypothetical protein